MNNDEIDARLRDLKLHVAAALLEHGPAGSQRAIEYALREAFRRGTQHTGKNAGVPASLLRR